MISKLSLIVLTFLFVWEGASGEIYFRKGAPHVKLSSGGVLSGKLSFSRDGRPFSSFVGFTYATVPERFAEAKLVTEPWQGVKEAVTPGPWCPQGSFAIVPTEQVSGEEDCLGMNVYVPMNNTGKEYPVMLWIHGGGLMFGDGYDLYGAKYFMDEDVILVTINYRVGVTGFLSTGDSVVPGNNGLKDMVLALEWIQGNIRRFGGNPEKVTVFGESGGAVAAHLLHISPTTRGLLHNVIVQSGSALQPYPSHPNPKATAAKLATHMKCPTAASDPSGISSQEILACLKAAPLAELVKAQNTFESTWPGISSFSFGPVAENGGPSSTVSPFLSDNPYAILTNRKHSLSPVPLMIGIAEEEGATMVDQIMLMNSESLNELNDKWDEIAPQAFDLKKFVSKDKLSTVTDKIRKFYFGTDPITKEKKEALIQLYSDQLTNYATYKSAVETAARGKHHPVYLYLYSYLGPSLADLFALPTEKKTKTRHGDELLYHFSINTPIEIPGSDVKIGEGQIIEPDSDHEQFSKNFVKLWTSFAIHGEPKHSWGISADRKWRPLSKEEAEGKRPLKYYKIDANPGHIDDPYKERMAFWDQLYKDHFEKSPALASVQNKRKTEL